MKSHRMILRSNSMPLACALAAGLLAMFSADGAVVTVPTMSPSALAAALNPQGLTITSVSIQNGVAGQFGTYNNFEILPVTIRPGIVLSSGDVTDLGPIPGATDPAYDPASPPLQVNNQMTPEPDSGGTPEFNAYGFTAGNIESFNGAFDVAAIRVDFEIAEDTQIKFDFVFGSVEYPYWTGQFTDSFLVFLDGVNPVDQITYDAKGNAVQVGSSFANLETTGDNNSAFSNPHGLIHHLTTTTARLDKGHHFLIFEVGDINDHILDSAAFITNLRAEAGTEGTEGTEDNPTPGCPHVTVHPDPVSLCPSAAADFSVAASGTGPLSYRWQWREAGSSAWTDLDEGVNSDPGGMTQFIATGASASNLNIVADTAPQGSLALVESLRCRINNSCGSDRSDPAAVRLCASDFNCDTQVDDSDFVLFASAYDLFDCTDPAMAPGCPFDLNRDGLVEDVDFVIFASAYEVLVCP